ncbi:MAG: hypothetical protein ABIA93_04715 [Candidatus Woesearchaeota archaeon]
MELDPTGMFGRRIEFSDLSELLEGVPLIPMLDMKTGQNILSREIDALYFVGRYQGIPYFTSDTAFTLEHMDDFPETVGPAQLLIGMEVSHFLMPLEDPEGPYDLDLGIWTSAPMQ